MAEIEVRRDTVVIDETVHEIYRQLTEGSETLRVPFRTMKDVFMWAATLGYQCGEGKQITGKKLTIFRWAQFSPQIDIPLLKAIGIADRKNVDVLLDQNEVLTIAEEYANRGIHELHASIMLEYGYPLWHLVSLLGNPGLSS